MAQVASDIVIEVDWDNDGDFDQPEENITAFVMEAETRTGRDWPSQLTGKAGPGLFRASLDNTDDRFSYFNALSPLNTAPFSLDNGRKLRVRTTTATNPDPALLARDRFRRAAGALGAEEGGFAWTNHLSATWVISDEQAVIQLVRDSSGAVTASEALATVAVGTTNLYAQATAPQRDGTNQIGLVYRFTDASNYGAVVWQGQGGSTEVAHFTNVAGVLTETFSSGVIEFQEDTTFGVLVAGTQATIYLNGVPMTTGTAYSGAGTRAGMYGDWDSHRLPVVDDFHVWAGLPTEVEGILWTGDVSDLTVSVVPGPRKIASLSGEGWLAKLAAADISPPTSVGVAAGSDFSVGQPTGVLVGKTLAKAGLLHPPGEIQTGEVTAGSVGLTNGKALDIARKFEELEFGFLHESQEGPIGFDSRTARDSSYSLATFSDAPTGTQLGYETIAPYNWRREVVNQVAAGVSPSLPQLMAVFGASVNNAAGVDTNANVTLPTAANGVAAGDLLIVFVIPTMGPANGQQWITPHGWVAYNPSAELGKVRIYAKRVETADLGATVTFYNDPVTGGSYIYNIFHIRSWYGSLTGGVHVAEPALFTGSDATSGTNQPPVIFPPWGREPTLFFATRSGMVSLVGGAVSGTAPPDGYGNFGTGSVNGTSNAYDVAFEQAVYSGNRDVEKPSPFTGTFTGYAFVENNVVAVRGFGGDPPERTGSRVVTSNDFTSQDDHNAVRSHRNPAELFRTEADARTYGGLILARYAGDRPIFQIGYTATQSAEHRGQAVARRVGDRITLIADNDTGLDVNSDFHIESIANRWTDGAKLWKVTWELSPAEAVNRADTNGSALDAGINSSVTTFAVDITDGPLWITDAEFPNMFPFEVTVDTEDMRVTSITGASSPQTFVVERGINGTTAASHSAAAALSLTDPWTLPV